MLAKFWLKPVSLASSSRFSAQEFNKLLSLVEANHQIFVEPWNEFSVLKMAPRAMAVVCSDDELRVSLTDGRWLSVPIAWFPRLAHASPAERADYELLGEGQGIHWPRVDEDISVEGLIAGQPFVEFKTALDQA